MSLIVRKLQLPFLRELFGRSRRISRVELGCYARPMAYGRQQGSRQGGRNLRGNVHTQNRPRRSLRSVSKRNGA